MSFTLKADQKVAFSVSGADETGNPVDLTGTPVFTVDDDAILSLTDNGDGSGEVAATGQLGSATLSVEDEETSGQRFIGSVAIDVIAGDLAAIGIDLGAPEEVTPDQ